MVLGLKRFDNEFFDNYIVNKCNSSLKTNEGIKGSILVRSKCKKDNDEKYHKEGSDKIITISPVYNQINEIEKLIIQEVEFFENMDKLLEQIYQDCYEIQNGDGNLEKFIVNNVLVSSSKDTVLSNKVLISSQSLKNTAVATVFQYTTKRMKKANNFSK